MPNNQTSAAPVSRRDYEQFVRALQALDTTIRRSPIDRERARELTENLEHTLLAHVDPAALLPLWVANADFVGETMHATTASIACAALRRLRPFAARFAASTDEKWKAKKREQAAGLARDLRERAERGHAT
ncbi:hypothetical protein CBA19CS42_26525 [Caballeronia novacaledonica]|uniref:Uncharacterized protein n=2 Tax=Caballeronia novacaledonica TaxID=1544861 RepID=A0AA37IGC4_9BURK|nr:hypothetical protein CBA19CS42_26525 [Caballeronia novacaledonica]